MAQPQPPGVSVISSAAAESSSLAASSSVAVVSSSIAAVSSSAAAASSSAAVASSSSQAAVSSSIAASASSVSAGASSVVAASSSSSAQAVSASSASAVQSSIAASSSASSAAAASSASAASASSESSALELSTSYVTQTITDGSGVRTSRSAVSTSTQRSGHSSKGGSNIGAIVGGVVGGVVGLALLAGLLWFFCFKRRKNKQAAFDEKTFDPGNRHSVNDPLDLLAPSVPNVNPGSSPHVDPFPYGGSPNQNMYDPYAHAPMQMPNANDYLANTGMGGNGPYPTFGSGEGGYGAAALGGAALGAGGAYAASHDSHSQGQGYQTSEGYPPTSPPPGNAKQREAAMERQRNRMSGAPGPSGFTPMSEGSGGGASSPPTEDGRRQSGIYQHTDMTSVPDEEEETAEEIPPNYNSIRR